MEDSFIVGQAGGLLILGVVEDGEALDISDATNLKVFLNSPTSDPYEFIGQFFTDGEDGLIKLAIPANLFAIGRPGVSGSWLACADFTLGAWSGPTSVTQFAVRNTLKRPA